MADADFLTGSSGLIAIDKVGNQVLFLDPDSYQTVLTLDGFTPRVHELLIAPDHATAYVPIYGDGIHGKNPHPGHLVALFDLKAQAACARTRPSTCAGWRLARTCTGRSSTASTGPCGSRIACWSTAGSG